MPGRMPPSANAARAESATTPGWPRSWASVLVISTAPRNDTGSVASLAFLTSLSRISSVDRRPTGTLIDSRNSIRAIPLVWASPLDSDATTLLPWEDTSPAACAWATNASKLSDRSAFPPMFAATNTLTCLASPHERRTSCTSPRCPILNVNSSIRAAWTHCNARPRISASAHGSDNPISSAPTWVI